MLYKLCIVLYYIVNAEQLLHSLQLAVNVAVVLIHLIVAVAPYTGWPINNVPNFRMALCSREIKMNQLTSKYLMSKHMRISLDIFA